MSILNFFRNAGRKNSAEQAKERLQIVMAHERIGRNGPEFLPQLQQDLLAVIAKYVDLDQNKVEVKLDRGGDCSTLEVNIELPARPSGSTVPAREAERAPANEGAVKGDKVKGDKTKDTAKDSRASDDKPAAKPAAKLA